MTTRILIASLSFLLVPTIASATSIKQRPYQYSSDAANAAESDVFVVCADSPDGRLTILPAPSQLAVRVGGIEARVDEARNMTAPARPGRSCVDCLLGTVHFSLDSSVLVKEERGVLDQLVRTIPPESEININGYTCDLGGAAHNLDLSLRRAKEVATYLSAKGVSVKKVTGNGQCCLVSEDRRLNRRVEITTSQKEEK